jgi:hypothetical protein
MTMIRRLICSTTLAGLVGLGSQGASAQNKVTYAKPMTSADVKRLPADPELTGAWRGAVTFSSGMFAGLKGLEYMYVFHGDGTMTESSNYDGVPPVPPAYGIWRKTAARTYEAKYQFFQTRAVKTSDELVKQGGFVPDGYGIIAQTMTLSADGNSFTSRISVAMFDTAGKPIAGGSSGTARATRIRF